jgi:hypothetical protein
MDRLNASVLPEGYLAQAQAHVGGRVEVDVASLEEPGAGASTNGGGTATLAAPAWAPPATDLALPLVFPDEIEVQVFRTSGGLTLVGAIELVSPGNKDRREARRAFAAKCLHYLSQGVGVVVVDIVTEYAANLHNELVALLGLGAPYLLSEQGPLYAVAYRPARRGEAEVADLWRVPLALGEALPIMPLGLRNAGCVPVELEPAYNDACVRNRI